MIKYRIYKGIEIQNIKPLNEEFNNYEDAFKKCKELGKGHCIISISGPKEWSSHSIIYKL
jgi:hypothetical protein